MRRVNDFGWASILSHYDATLLYRDGVWSHHATYEVTPNWYGESMGGVRVGREPGAEEELNK